MTNELFDWDNSKHRIELGGRVGVAVNVIGWAIVIAFVVFIFW